MPKHFQTQYILWGRKGGCMGILGDVDVRKTVNEND